MKRYILFCAMPLMAVFCLAQHDPVLMKVNGKEVLRSEFEYLYNKNKNIHTLNKENPEKYIDLFVNYKLKVSAAEAAGIDTTTAFRSELAGYRRQLAKSYLTDITAEGLRTEQNVKSHTVVEGWQIFKYLPQNTPAYQQHKAEQQMDSLYRIIVRNPKTDFKSLVNAYSDDKNLFSMNRLQMPEEFENMVFSLNKGEVSKPFLTPQGIHIVKLVDKKEEIRESAKILDKENEALLNTLKAEYNYTPNHQGIDELLLKGETNKLLFSINEQLYFGRDFVLFAHDNPYGLKKQINDFIRKSLYDYENSRLELKYPEFRLLMQEYRDGMLLFEISDREVWNKAFNDKTGLQNYFAEHKENYQWKLPRYKGIIIHCPDKKTGKGIKKQLKRIPENERMNFLKENYNNSPVSIIVQEGTFAVGQNEFVDKLVFKVGAFTPIQSHPVTITVGQKVKGPEHYKEVQGSKLIDDYQKFLESRWTSQLRKNSKVEINEEVLKTVNNH
ncbi:peptidyl-prolyl cis-trans isomerase [Bacteroides sp. OttesenSCG-928-J23]|nr:peptidyl-prolyl cis-trans isomerase [Bacteroides sp. OttesenSCG-928-J23]MDL2306231.1 peptidyl-prolyl cis-trans isomerase [Bacteroides sp. OttesenSCG-928-D19]